MNVRKVSWLLPATLALYTVYALIVALTQGDGGGLEWLGVIVAGAPWSLVTLAILNGPLTPVLAQAGVILSALLNLYLLTVLAMYISRDTRLARIIPRKVSSSLMRRWA